MKLSSYTNIPASATLAMNALVQEKKRKGEQVFNLTVGEPLLPTHALIQEAAMKAMQDGKTLYPPVAGIPELRHTVAQWMNAQFSSDIQSQNVLVSCGGKHGLLLALHALLEPGDEVLIPAPYWVSYPTMVTLARGVPTIVSTQKDVWKITPEQIEQHCTDKTRMLIVNSGGNPTGVVYSRSELQAIVETAKKKHLILVSDEVYSGLTYDNNEFVSLAEFPEYKDDAIIIQSCSKHFAMTGWRVGFVLGPKFVIDAIETLQSQSTTGTSSISQWAALAAFENAQEVNGIIREAMQQRRNVFVSALKKYFGYTMVPPQAGLYAFLPLSVFDANATDSIQFCMNMLQQYNVAFVPGLAFGAEGYVRASFGAKPEDIENALKHLSEKLKV